VPRQRLAVGADSARSSASPRASSPAIDQLRPDLKALDGPSGTRSISRSARLGGSLPARRRLDRALNTHLWPALRRRSSTARGHPRITARRGDHRRCEAAEVDFTFDMRVTRLARGAAHHRAVLRRCVVGAGCAGEQVDRDLAAGDVRLPWAANRPSCRSTISGRRWNTDAVGPTKREKLTNWRCALRARFARGGLLHHGQANGIRGKACRVGHSRSIGRRRRADLAQSGFERARSAHDVRCHRRRRQADR